MSTKTAKWSYGDPVDPDLVWITPRGAIAAFRESLYIDKEITSRMLSHWVPLTIGESPKPAEGRGSSRGFSIKAVTTMAVGIALSDQLTLPPHKVRICCKEILAGWNSVFPQSYQSFFSNPEDALRRAVEETRYLIGLECKPNDFWATIGDQDHMSEMLRGFAWRPAVVVNLTLPISTMVLSLMAEYNNTKTP